MNESIRLYIDESYRGEFLGVAIVALIGEENFKITKNILDSLSKDLVFKHRNGGSEKIHYVDNNLGPRINMIDKIYQMPISVYLSYKKKNVSYLTKKQKDDLAYKELLPDLLKPVAIKYKKIFKDGPVNINLQFEQLSDKKEADKLFFANCINQKLKLNFNINVVDKNDILTSLPDYFLGFLGSFISEPASNWPKKDLELVESKIGLIIDATDLKKKYYQRGDEIRGFIKDKCSS